MLVLNHLGFEAEHTFIISLKLTGAQDMVN